MKKILFIFMTVLVSALAMATTKSDQYRSNNLYVMGSYNTSAYDGLYRLLDENGFPKRACVMGVQLNSLPEGYHYS